MTAYLDHAATTPMLPSAIAAMAEQLGATGNASSLHTSGRAARRVVEESRERLAKAIGARPSEVVFTSGGTESDNLALKGAFQSRREQDPARTRLVVSGIEHHAVLDCVEHLVAREGATVTWVEPDAQGVVSAAAVRAAIEEDPESVAVVSVMWANNEVGTVQPVREVVRVAHEHGIPVHSDAVQALGHVPVDFAGSDLDLMTITAHKVGGPLGVGALVVKRSRTLVPQSHGGGQERQVRSGTLDTPAIRGFAVAVEEAVARLEEEAARVVALRDRLITVRPRPRLRHHGERRLGGRRRHTAPARQRAPAGARLRGRLPPLPPRRRGRGVLHRLGLPGRRAATQPRAARDGCLGAGRPRRPAAHPRPHVHRCRRRRVPLRAAGRGRAGPARLGGGQLMRVVAAMSGGVDSAVAAARMLDAGHEVVGVHLALSQSAATLRESARGCCTIEDAGDARRVADMLGIPFYVWDMAARFKRDVMDDFVAEYSAGRTPNPCLRCNEKIKFAALLDKALALGFDAVATGHYAQVVERPDGGRELHRAVDRAKDQSYVLGVLTADQLARSFFPLGDTAKPQIRAEAKERGFYVASKPDSHDICFIADGDTRRWLTERLGEQPGDIVDAGSGQVVGAHAGAYAYTIGQRRGLGLDRSSLDGSPRYVVDVDAATNTVTIGTADLLGVNALTGDHARWCGPAPDGVIEVGAQVRAHGEEVSATAWADGDRVEVRLAERIRGVAPGQSVVLYEGTRVVGSATIASAALER